MYAYVCTRSSAIKDDLVLDGKLSVD